MTVTKNEQETMVSSCTDERRRVKDGQSRHDVRTSSGTARPQKLKQSQCPPGQDELRKLKHPEEAFPALQHEHQDATTDLNHYAPLETSGMTKDPAGWQVITRGKLMDKLVLEMLRLREVADRVQKHDPLRQLSSLIRELSSITQAFVETKKRRRVRPLRIRR